jgi:hypothetical protein
MKTTPSDKPLTGEADSESLTAILRAAARGWDRFWFTPRDPTGLGLIRICVGIILLYVHFAYCFGLVRDYVGKDAWLNDGVNHNGVLHWMRYELPAAAPANDWSDNVIDLGKGGFIWSIYFHVQDPLWIWVIHISVLVAMFLFTIGFCTRVTGVLTWLGVITYIHRTPALLFGMDTMTNLAALYLMVSPCGAALSVDRWLALRRERRKHGPGWVPPPPEPLVSATFASRLIQINFCIIYFASGTSKLLGTSWWNGTAPNMVLLNWNFAPFSVGLYSQALTSLARTRWLWEIFMSVGVVFTLFVELGLPFLVWNRRLRWFMVCGSILLHTAIGLFMNLVTFSLVMICMVLAFLPPEAIRQALERYGEQLGPLFRSRTDRNGVPSKEKAAVAAK